MSQTGIEITVYDKNDYTINSTEKTDFSGSDAQTRAETYKTGKIDDKNENVRITKVYEIVLDAYNEDEDGIFEKRDDTITEEYYVDSSGRERLTVITQPIGTKRGYDVSEEESE